MKKLIKHFWKEIIYLSMFLTVAIITILTEVIGHETVMDRVFAFMLGFMFIAIILTMGVGLMQLIIGFKSNLKAYQEDK